jgi:uridine monophosphate synthetase
VDLRLLVAHPEALREAGELLAERLRPLAFDRIAGLVYAGLPLGVAAALAGGFPLCYARKEAKEYGTRKLFEGEPQPGERIAFVDDVITDGGAKIEEAVRFRDAGLVVEDVVVLVDREQGGREQLAATGLTLHACFTLRELLTSLHQAGHLDGAAFQRVMEYLAGA